MVNNRMLSKIRLKCLGLLLIFSSLSFQSMAQMRLENVYHQDIARQELWDLNALYKLPNSKILKTDRGVQSILFQSVDYQGQPTEVFAYYSNPDMLTGKQSSEKFPGIVLLHGGGGKAFQEWVEKWAAQGYAAIAMDFAGKDGDGKKLENGGPDQGGQEKFTSISTGPLKDVWTYHAVASGILAHTWLRAQPSVDSALTFVTGISWGGYLTNIVGSVDYRFKAAVPVYGCGYYGESDIFKKDLEKLTEANRAKWLKYFDPSAYLPTAQVDFLFVNGNKDRFYNVVPYHKTYSLVPETSRQVCIKPDMSHSHPAGWEPLEIRTFFDHIAFGLAASPTVQKVKIQDGQISASFTSPVSLAAAHFYYTNDTLSTNEKRVWQSVKAVEDREKQLIYCPIPEEGFKYGFFSIKDHRSVMASSEFVIKD